jgi:hypothetical protein
MRKFLMAAGLLALVACGDKKPAADAGMAGATTTMADSTHRADSMHAAMMADSIKKDSIMKDSIAKAGAMSAPKKP